MPPATAATAHKKQKQDSASPRVAGPAVNDDAVPEDKFNKDYLTKLGNAVSRVLSHENTKDMRQAAPLICGGAQQFQEKP